MSTEFSEIPQLILTFAGFCFSVVAQAARLRRPRPLGGGGGVEAELNLLHYPNGAVLKMIGFNLIVFNR